MSTSLRIPKNDGTVNSSDEDSRGERRDDGYEGTTGLLARQARWRHTCHIKMAPASAPTLLSEPRRAIAAEVAEAEARCE